MLAPAVTSAAALSPRQAQPSTAAKAALKNLLKGSRLDLSEGYRVHSSHNVTPVLVNYSTADQVAGCEQSEML